jgi:hypothetical protein
MRKTICVLTLVLVAFLLPAQEQELPVFSSVFGPRVGLTWIVADPTAFNDAIQLIKPAPGRTYFPILTQFGVSLEQHIRLGSTNAKMAFQEVVLVGGLEQNLAIPSGSLLIGFRAGFGLEIGIGPFFYMTVLSGGDVAIVTTVVAAIGYTVSFSNVNIPIDVAIVPVPADGRPRISLLTGFNFSNQKAK